MSIDVGDIPVITATFRDTAGTLATPTNRTCRILAPSGAFHTPTPIVEGTGVLRAEGPEIARGEAGRWFYWFKGWNAPDDTQATVGHFDVGPAPAAP